MVLRVKPTPTRFPTDIQYTPVESTPLHSLYQACGARRVGADVAISSQLRRLQSTLTLNGVIMTIFPRRPEKSSLSFLYLTGIRHCNVVGKFVWLQHSGPPPLINCFNLPS